MKTIIRNQVRKWGVLAAGLLLAGYFFFVYQPLSYRVDSLNESLATTWKRLPASGTAPDLAEIEQAYKEMEAASGQFQGIRRTLAGRLDLEAGIMARMREPFQLIGFQNERQLLVQEIEGQAKAHGVALEPAVVASFPKYTADQRQPALLWAQMELMRQVLALAIRNRAASIQRMELAPIRSQPLPGDATGSLDQLFVRIQLVSSMEAVSRILLSLPLKADEIKALGFPEAPATKPALFIDKIVLRKHSPEKPDEVYLDMRVCGYVFRE